MSSLPLFARAAGFGDRLAVTDGSGSLGYGELLEHSRVGALRLLEQLSDVGDLDEARVAFLVPGDRRYPIVQWSIWRAGGVAVPLCTTHPEPELEYVLRDAAIAAIVVGEEFEGRVERLAGLLGVPLIPAEEVALPADPWPEVVAGALPVLDSERRALFVYTSGTTGGPKGVVTTHGNLQAQIESMVEAWRWSRDDAILLVLPLHHVHGIVNVLCCALWSGATCHMRSFDALEVWSSFGDLELSLFMAVPTIYRKLIDAWEEASPEWRAVWSEGAHGLRLMVSGSAALPVSVLERWQEIAGQRLLERYGMSETGMILSNPLDGERRPGFVGTEMPGVEVRLRDGGEIVTTERGEAPEGELLVRGPGVFREYWNREEATRDAFEEGGWFRTGDRVRLEAGSYRILGRTSVDIVKTGGYKVSALEIEEVLRTHPAIRECAVVGLPDETWGERLAVAVVAAGEPPTLEALREWAKERLAPYKVPTLLRVVDELPRNPLGKVVKPTVKTLF